MDKYQLRTLMVLFTFEQELGQYVIKKNSYDNLKPNLIKTIANREEEAGKAFNIKNINDIVEATYIGEILDLAIQSSQGTSDEEILKKVKKYADFINIITIRNRISHTNREYKIQYWYQVASLASMPEIKILGFNKLLENLISAENDSIEEPPPEWIYKIESVVPKIKNNLPQKFDYASTGILGRKDQLNQLGTVISNDRISIVSIVAPGGIGKTALALEFLNQLSIKNDSKFDGIIFVSLKSEELTIEGIKSLSTIKSINEIKKSILYIFNSLWDKEFDSFESLISSNMNSKPLLFIDNLETLMCNTPESFEEFHNNLPSSWKLLITSRIPVSYSHNIALKSLSIDNSKKLAKSYYNKKSGNILNETYCEEILKISNNNPLAIKLSLDHLAIGNTVKSTLSKVNEDITEYSFRNLINSISPTSKEVMEALFALTQCTRAEVASILDHHSDNIAIAFSELSRTSLIHIEYDDSQNEIYSMIPSVKDYIRLNPTDMSLRRNLLNKIRSLKDKVRQISSDENKHSLSSFDYRDIPQDIPDDLKLHIKKVNILQKKYIRECDGNLLNEVTNIYSNLNKMKNDFKNLSIYHRTIARVYNMLCDNESELNSLLRARSIDPDDIATQIMLGRYYDNQSQYFESEKIYKELFKLDKINTPENRFVWKSIIDGYSRCLLFQEKINEILNYTKNWESDGSHQCILGIYRASAYKRLIEKAVCNPDSTLYNYFSLSLDITTSVLKKGDYHKLACKESKKLVLEILRFFERLEEIEPEHVRNSCLKFLNFCDAHIKEIVLSNENKDLYPIICRMKSLKIKDNPFGLEKWEYLNNTNTDLDDSFKDDIIDTTVINIPRWTEYRKSFVFSKDSFGQRYYIHKSSFQNGDESYFNNLEVGSGIRILPKDVGKQLPESEFSWYVNY